MPPKPAELERLRQAKAELTERFLSPSLEHGVLAMQKASLQEAADRAGRQVHAVGIGRKVVKGVKTDDWAVRVYVLQKVDPKSASDVVPPQINGVPTDVIESSPAFLAENASSASVLDGVPTVQSIADIVATIPPACSSNKRQPQNPVIAGVSTGRNGGDCGTIACFCRSTHPDDNPADDFVLSNSHIFGTTKGANLFQQAPGEPAIFTPLHFADLHRSTSPMPGGKAINTVDAAIGLVRPGVAHNPAICSIGRVSGTLGASDSLPVMKHGRTSGPTSGTVEDESCDCLVGLNPANPSVTFRFAEQVRIEGIGTTQFATFGDSGSLVVHQTSLAAIGLLFAVPLASTDTYAYANPIGMVLSQLEINIL
jgi:hypothetical protein